MTLLDVPGRAPVVVLVVHGPVRLAVLRRRAPVGHLAVTNVALVPLDDLTLVRVDLVHPVTGRRLAAVTAARSVGRALVIVALAGLVRLVVALLAVVAAVLLAPWSVLVEDHAHDHDAQVAPVLDPDDPEGRLGQPASAGPLGNRLADDHRADVALARLVGFLAVVARTLVAPRQLALLVAALLAVVTVG